MNDLKVSKTLLWRGHDSEWGNLYFRAMATISLVALCVGFALEFGVLRVPRAFGGLIFNLAVLVPAIREIAMGPPEPAVGMGLLASQWILFPFYLSLLLLSDPPWGRVAKARFRTIIAMKKAEGRGGRSLLALLFFLFSISSMFLADFQLADFPPSFIRGKLFQSGAAILSAQNKSAIAMVIVSWISPIIESYLWLGFLCSLHWVYLYFQPEIDP